MSPQPATCFRLGTSGLCPHLHDQWRFVSFSSPMRLLPLSSVLKPGATMLETTSPRLGCFALRRDTKKGLGPPAADTVGSLLALQPSPESEVALGRLGSTRRAGEKPAGAALGPGYHLQSPLCPLPCGNSLAVSVPGALALLCHLSVPRCLLPTPFPLYIHGTVHFHPSTTMGAPRAWTPLS